LNLVHGEWIRDKRQDTRGADGKQVADNAR
jgi:hypothetical protein